MGRIAEALKRAQQERAERIGQVGESPAPGGPTMRSARLSGRGLSRAESFSEVAQSLLNPPPPPQPFPINACPIPAEAVSAEVMAFHEPNSPTAEKYRSVRTRLITANPGGGPRVLAISSAMHREGKTVTAGNLGFCFAELKYLRTAMVDLDFHRRGLSYLLGAEGQPGLAEILRGEMTLADVCMPAVRDNLYLIPAGEPAGASASELLASKFVGNLFRELAERFHYSFIDTPPVDENADAGLIAPLCHAVIFVARSNHTPEPLVERCVKRLQANRATVAGCILTGYREPGISCEPHDYFQSTP